MNSKTWLLIGVLAGILNINTGCKPKTTAQKVEDKMEDAQHEAGQGMERAGEKVEDATSK
jgi:hypothetical protein